MTWSDGCFWPGVQAGTWTLPGAHCLGPNSTLKPCHLSLTLIGGGVNAEWQTLVGSRPGRTEPLIKPRERAERKL